MKIFEAVAAMLRVNDILLLAASTTPVRFLNCHEPLMPHEISSVKDTHTNTHTKYKHRQFSLLDWNAAGFWKECG